MLEQFNENENICFSGGAKGADLLWGQMARNAGHAVIHWSFAKHKTRASDEEIYILNETELEEADEFLEEANKILKRKLPYSKPWIINLLRRNYYQVKWSRSIYGVGYFLSDGEISGGTAWAFALAKILKIEDMYFFDQELENWFLLNEIWRACKEIPKPTGQWTGIGTRNLNESGKLAIKSIFRTAS